MPQFEMYQTVRVARSPSRDDASWLKGTNVEVRVPSVGETGTVVEVLTNPRERYLVERCSDNGQVEWLVEFEPQELEAI